MLPFLAECEVPVVRPPLSGNRVGQVAAILFAIWVIYSIVQFRDWTARAEIIAFVAGAGGTALTFYRWRRHSDKLAKVLCLAAFGAWILACIIWPIGGAHADKPGAPGFDAAAVALLAGFAGGIVVLIRLCCYRDRVSSTQLRQTTGSTPPP